VELPSSTIRPVNAAVCSDGASRRGGACRLKTSGNTWRATGAAATTAGDIEDRIERHGYAESGCGIDEEDVGGRRRPTRGLAVPFSARQIRKADAQACSTGKPMCGRQTDDDTAPVLRDTHEACRPTRGDTLETFYWRLVGLALDALIRWTRENPRAPRLQEQRGTAMHALISPQPQRTACAPSLCHDTVCSHRS